MKTSRPAAGLLLAFLFVALLAMSAQADLITRATGFGDGADTYANERETSTPQGNLGEVLVKTDSASRRIGYLRFDIGALGAGVTSDDIRDASLTMTTSGTSNNFTFGIFGLVDMTDADRAPTHDATTGGWNELNAAGLTWNNAPARNGGSISTTTSYGTPSSYAVLLGTFELSSIAANTTFTVGFTTTNATQSVDLAGNLEDFLRADSNGLASLVIRRSGSNNSTLSAFHSKENTGGFTPPTLTFNTVIPEPVSLSILGLGGLCLLGGRRRKA